MAIPKNGIKGSFMGASIGIAARPRPSGNVPIGKPPTP